jgi:preprotein translocase subunit SecF
MEFFRIRRTIPFMRHALKFNIASLVMFALAVLFLATRGLHFSIEFTGGTVMEVKYGHAAEPETVRNALQGIGLTDVTVQNFGSSEDILVRLPLKEVPGSSLNVEMQ